ncbi:hypothetical protein L6164_013199 [Bauhinia variegata]|uniref:Uncharacterized protein n=1 Tax=Bauhinia variegata TaxID=167791 RepID=A0ACB9PBL1_BAUVA|nr:hypothetical protein L6164_013199 [Bauhinia variegata]
MASENTVATNISSIKAFVEAINEHTTIPSNYYSFIDPRDGDEVDDTLAAFIPVIDYSLLTSMDSEMHAKGIQELGKACKEWGFFMVINHGISENLMESVLAATRQFFEMTDEEKQQFSDKGVLCPIRHGTSMNTKAEDVHFWRDYLKVFTHPQFCIPNVPAGFRETAFEYCKRVREVTGELYKGMSESLGLEANAIPNALGFGTDFQLLVANLYPPCPQPDAALGQPPHSDNGSLTFLIQNGIGGLQVHHKGKWVNVNPLSNSIMVNISDQLEIITNGIFKGVLHRAVLKNQVTRVSLAMVHGPSFDKLPELVKGGKQEFEGMNYKQYFLHHQGNKLVGKTNLDHARA